MLNRKKIFLKHSLLGQEEANQIAMEIGLSSPMHVHRDELLISATQVVYRMIHRKLIEYCEINCIYERHVNPCQLGMCTLCWNNFRYMYIANR